MMTNECEPESIEDVLDCLEEAGGDEQDIRISHIVDRIGDGAFAPLLLVPALIMLSPATAIFGIATVCASLIALIAVQIVIGRDSLWLPRFILDRGISAKRRDSVVEFLSKPAHYVDSLTRARLSFIVEPPFDRLWAGICVLLVLFVPLLEIVPMSASTIGAAISLFALAMLAKDGLFALLGLIVLGGAIYLLFGVAT